MFRGQYEHAIDKKGRTAVPARFRDALENLVDERLIVTRFTDPCLVAFPLGEWKKFEQKISAGGIFEKRFVKLRRFLIANAVECELDKHGRILLPPSLREQAGLSDQVVWVGQVRFSELWSPAQWKIETARVESELKEGLDDLTDLGL
jgi:MraZ protein